jgi:uracil-DNA glycosylase
MPQVRLILAIGQYAQAWHLGPMRRKILTETVAVTGAVSCRNPIGMRGAAVAASLLAQQRLD